MKTFLTHTHTIRFDSIYSKGKNKRNEKEIKSCSVLTLYVHNDDVFEPEFLPEYPAYSSYSHSSYPSSSSPSSFFNDDSQGNQHLWLQTLPGDDPQVHIPDPSRVRSRLSADDLSDFLQTSLYP